METDANITAAMFAAYLICRTKAYLMVHGEKPPDPVFAEMRNRVSAAYKALARQRLLTGSTVPIDFSRLTDGVIGDGGTAFVDCETALYVIDGTSSASLDHRASRAGSDRPYVPILYSAWEKSDQSDDLLVCFGALAIAQATGAEIPPNGKVVYGEGCRTKTIRIPEHLPKTRQIVQKIASTCFSREEPRLVLNEHCPTCDFQSRCRALAVERDGLEPARNDDGERASQMPREGHFDDNAPLVRLSPPTTTKAYQNESRPKRQTEQERPQAQSSGH